MTSRDLRYWRLIHEMKVDQASMLISGIDPNDVSGASGSEVGRAMTLEMAIRQAGDRAHRFAHNAVHRNEPEWPTAFQSGAIWDESENFHHFLPSIELRESVKAVFADPVTVPLLVPIDPWFSETISGGEFARWIEANGIESSFDFSPVQTVVVRELNLEDFNEWVAERHARESGSSQKRDALNWPWGSHTTWLLEKLADATKKFWVNFDPDDVTTAPTNAQVVSWLKANGVADRVAEVMASILRVEGLPMGPRK